MLNTPTAPTITNEQINSVPLLLGICEAMGIRTLLDAHVKPHGAWQGASVGTLVTIWLAHILQERSHCLLAVRDWVAARCQSINTILGCSLRDTDFTDDRLANVLSMLSTPQTQAALNSACVQQWVRVYRLPVHTIRLDSTSVSVYHQPDEPDSLLQLGHSKDHRPDLRQFKAMLSTLDPLGLPVCCQALAGQCADDGLYVPAYEAAANTLGTRELFVVGDSKMGALANRGHLSAHGSRYLCSYRPPAAGAELAAWVERALLLREQWQVLETCQPLTGELQQLGELVVWEREQSWCDPADSKLYSWRERVLLYRSAAYQRGLCAVRLRQVERATVALAALWAPSGRGRKRYRTREQAEAAVAEILVRYGVAELLAVTVGEDEDDPGQPLGARRWVPTGIAVRPMAWAGYRERQGWQVYLTNSSAEQYEPAQLVAAYHGQPVHERGFARLKSRTLQIRPVYLRDEQRISGLLWLLTLALQVLTLSEYRVRQALAAQQTELAGLNPASRSQTTARPTTERLIAAFSELTVTVIRQGELVLRFVTALNCTQAHILRLLDLPADLYSRLASPLPNSS